MIGGDCGTEVAPISYLARRHGLELAVIWLDAHPDLHTPCSSPTKTFHGMPLRTLLGEGDDLILQYAGPAIEPHQIFLCGVRDADPAELEYLAANRSVSHHSIEELSVSAEGLIGSLKSMGFKKLYIHIDLDVLDPAAFPHVPCPTPGGLSLQSLQAVVKCLASEFEIVGLSLLEFLATRSEQTAKAASDAETIARLVWRTFQDQL